MTYDIVVYDLIICHLNDEPLVMQWGGSDTNCVDKYRIMLSKIKAKRYEYFDFDGHPQLYKLSESCMKYLF